MTDLANPLVTDARVAELYAKQQITEVLYLRARAGDRRDDKLTDCQERARRAWLPATVQGRRRRRR